jgi:hypothetical protein
MCVCDLNDRMLLLVYNKYALPWAGENGVQKELNKIFWYLSYRTNNSLNKPTF